jgi:hypothetical protein
MNAGASFTYAPLRFVHLFPSVTLESLLSAQAALPAEKVGQYRIEWSNYFLICHRAIGEVAAKGHDVSIWLRAWTEALSDQEPAVQREVTARLEQEKYAAARHKLRGLASRMARLFTHRSRDGESNGNRSLDTTALGLGNIADCAKYLATIRH